MSRLWQRIVAGIVIGLVLMFARHAFAAVPPIYTTWSFPTLSLTASTPEAVCELVRTSSSVGTNATIQTFAVGSSATKYTCIIKKSVANGGGTYGSLDDISASGALSCPSNSTGTTTCTCSAGYQDNTGHTACEKIPTELEQFCKDGLTNRWTWKLTGSTAAGAASSMPDSSCYTPDPPFDGVDAGKGCVATTGGGVAAPQPDGSRKWSALGVFTGATCTPGSTAVTPPIPSEDDKCPGGFAGTVSGVERCIPAEPDKGIEGTKKTVETGTDGTKKEITESTKCEGQTCTTTTSIKSTTSGGVVTNTTSVVVGNIEDKCVKDPTNQICKKTGTGPTATTSEEGGGCDDSSDTIGCMRQGTPVDGEIPTTTKEFTFAPSPISGFGNACPQPTSFAVAGQTFTASYTPLCDAAGWVKPLVLLAAALAATAIVYRSLSGS